MGVFAALPPISNFTDIKDIVIADVNGDGKNDIIVSRIANADAVSVFIHQNVNMPAFNPPQTFSVGDNPVDLALADLDNDNDLDIITANSGAVFGTLTIRANDGSGNFSAPPVTLSVGNSADFLAIGDLDGDNDLEIGTKDVGGNAIAFFNDTPAISEFTNKIVDVGQPIAPINFIISKPSDMFVFSAFSTNTAIIPNDAFSFEGTDTNRTLLIKPALANGVTLITVIVSNAITRFTASNHFNLIAINEPNKPLTGYTLDLRQPKTSKTKKFKSTKGFKFKARVITTNTVHNVFFATVIPGDTNNTNITFIAADKVKILDEKKKLFRKKGVRAVARSKSNKAGVKTPADTTSLNFIVKVTGTAGTNVGEVLFTNTLTTQVK
ncbi:MAG: FG-GAP-like repeat-containing protein [Verrucomicrobiia bacterium]